MSRSPKGVDKKVPLSLMYGMRVAVDTSIYLYMFKKNGGLLENLFLMISTFQKNNITPCFIFDGEPPEEKKELLRQRREERYNAKLEYWQLKEKLDAMNPAKTAEEEALINLQLEQLKRLENKSVRVTLEDICDAKELMNSMGAPFIVADGEADSLCAKLVIKKYVDVCLSDDMDMFVYGTPLVWRHLNLATETVFVYDLRQICEDLNVSRSDLREICIVSGTDYEIKDYNLSIREGTGKKCKLDIVLNLFNKYRESRSRKDFFEWISESGYFEGDIMELYVHLTMFDTRFTEIDKTFFGHKGSLVRYNKGDMTELKRVLFKEDFFFPSTNYDELISGDNMVIT